MQLWIFTAWRCQLVLGFRDDRLDSNRLIVNATEPRTTNTLHQNNFGVSIPSSQTAINRQFSVFLIFSAQIACKGTASRQRKANLSIESLKLADLQETSPDWRPAANHQNFQIDGASLWGPSLLRSTRTRNNCCLHTKGSTWGIWYGSGQADSSRMPFFKLWDSFLKTKVMHNRGCQAWRAKLTKSPWVHGSREPITLGIEAGCFQCSLQKSNDGL